MKTKTKILAWIFGSLFMAGSTGYVYIKTHPLVFNESFFSHAHCIAGTDLALRMYAEDHNGNYPAHPNGYGDALLLLAENNGGFYGGLTGPGYDSTPFEIAVKNKTHLAEKDCRRVYVQGLNKDRDPEIAILFDKIATPGDHCQGLRRLSAPLGHEVWTDDTKFVTEADWPAFAKKQIELLVQAGIPRQRAEELYAQAETKK